MEIQFVIFLAPLRAVTFTQQSTSVNSHLYFKKGKDISGMSFVPRHVTVVL